MNLDDAPCAGQSRLFDATDPRSHERARAICATCPVIVDCRKALLEARRKQIVPGAEHGPEGTWAGILLTGKAPSKRRKVA